ncbi:MAG TPA: ABC transporter ATP-binding protein [Usitatibacter sp.]|nr:ABC transporter ATP-binding protein [Usitatibacter sp.]
MAEFLRIAGLVKRFGGVAATDGLDLTLREGEVHAVIGPNGAGKSTLIHQVSGALVPDAGLIAFEGRDITRMAMHERVAAGIARSFQVTNVFSRLGVLDNVALAAQARRGSSFAFWRPAIAQGDVFAEAAQLLDRVGLASRAGDTAATLSHGEQRRLEVALALATRARLLLLDEPMAGMDLAESAELVELLRNVRAQATLLLVEHDMDAVFRLADRISVLVYGRVIATGTPAEIRANDAVRRAYLGDDAAVA